MVAARVSERVHAEEAEVECLLLSRQLVEPYMDPFFRAIESNTCRFFWNYQVDWGPVES